MRYPHLEAPLKALVLKYRDVPFTEWERLYREGNEYNDYSAEGEPFWQAHADVLEVP
jgi:hypothetical protein